MLACRKPTGGGGRRCCCVGGGRLGAELLRALPSAREGALCAGRNPRLGGGFGTGFPASTEDWRDVGGSRIGCRVSSPGIAKSRAAEPGKGPRKPSLTPWVLELSWGVSEE